MEAYNVENLYRKISEKLTMRGAFRERAGWTRRQVKLGKLHPQWLLMLQTMEDILEEFFPGYWDIHTQVETEYGVRANPGMAKSWKMRKTTFWPVVHIPETTIRNSKRVKHQILDIFLKFQVVHKPEYGEKTFNFGSLQGNRATLSDLEYNSSYNHSHFQGSSREFKFSHCCTGSGEINQLFAQLNAKFDEDTFRLLMLQLKTYASWESLEGHPYKRIEEIIPREKGVQSRLNSTDVEAYALIILEYMQANKIKVNWNLVDNVPKIVQDSKFDNALKFLGPELTSYDEETVGLIQVVSENGKVEFYQAAAPVNGNPRKPRKVKGFIPFRGKEFPLAVLPPENREAVKQKAYSRFYINQNIKQNVIRQLETRAARLADPVRNGVLRHLKGEAPAPAGVHAEGEVPLW